MKKTKMSVHTPRKYFNKSKTELMELFLQYEQSKITLKQLSQYLDLCERQSKRRYDRWKLDGTIFPKRGYGCKIPYSSHEFVELVKQMYNTPYSNSIHVKNISNSSLLRHIRNITYPSKCYLLSHSSPDDTLLSFEIFGKRISSSNLHLVVSFIIKTSDHTLKYKNVRIENEPLSLYYCNTPEYNELMYIFFKNMSLTYFQQLKMRNMDRMDDVSCINAYSKYYNELLTSIKDNELYEAIHNISKTSINMSFIPESPLDSVYMLNNIAYDIKIEEDEVTNKLESDIHSENRINENITKYSNCLSNYIRNDNVKYNIYPSDPNIFRFNKNIKLSSIFPLNSKILPSDPQYGELTVLESEFI